MTTDDLLQRLRAHTEAYPSALFDAAAEEIESLRAEVRALHRNGEEAERWKVALQGAFVVQMNLTNRAESAERERDALAKRYADSESNLALCDAALQDVTRERGALRERIAKASAYVVSDAVEWDGAGMVILPPDLVGKRVLVVEDGGK